MFLVTGQGRKKGRWKLPWIKITRCSVGLFGFFLLWGWEIRQQDTHWRAAPPAQCYMHANTCIQPLYPTLLSPSAPCPQPLSLLKASKCWKELPELFISLADMPYLLKSSSEEALKETFAIKRHEHSYCKGQKIQRRSKGYSSKCDMGISLGSGHWHQNSMKHTWCFSTTCIQKMRLLTDF